MLFVSIPPLRGRQHITFRLAVKPTRCPLPVETRGPGRGPTPSLSGSRCRSVGVPAAAPAGLQMRQQGFDARVDRCPAVDRDVREAGGRLDVAPVYRPDRRLPLAGGAPSPDSARETACPAPCGRASAVPSSMRMKTVVSQRVRSAGPAEGQDALDQQVTARPHRPTMPRATSLASAPAPCCRGYAELRGAGSAAA